MALPPAVSPPSASVRPARPFTRPVAISLADALYTPPAVPGGWFWTMGAYDAGMIDLAYSCEGERCGVRLVPSHVFSDYREAGVGQYDELAARLAAAGREPAAQAEWAGRRVGA